MAHGFNSSKTFARPAHQAIEKASDDSINEYKSEQRKLDNMAMRLARRAQNRILANEGKTPGTTLFSK